MSKQMIDGCEKCRLSEGRIFFCPLHAAAQQMYEVLEYMESTFSVYLADDEDCFHCKIKAALAAARGVK